MKPLILLAALALAAPAVAQTRAGAVPDWTKGAPIAITMTGHGFVPARIVLTHGKPYVLRFRNTSSHAHNFSAKSFFDQALVSPRDQAWVAHDTVTLAAGQSATIHIVAPTTPGARYDFRSTRVADADNKMKGAIYVR